MGGLTKPLFMGKLRPYKRLTNYQVVCHSVLSFAPSISHGPNGQGPDAMLTSVFQRNAISYQNLYKVEHNFRINNNSIYLFIVR